MGILRSLATGLGEVVLLRHAEARARERGEERTRDVKGLKAAARLRLVASRKMSSAVAAVVLLDAALRLAVEAARAEAGDAGDAPVTAAELERYAPSVAPAARARVEAHLGDADPLAVDALPPAHAERLRDALDRVVGKLLSGVDARSVVELRALRYGRVAALVLVPLLLLGGWARAALLPRNIALGKPVYTSPLRFNPPNPSQVTDGRTRGTYNVHTVRQAHPFVTVDLERSYHVDRVRVYNRGDGWFDDMVPLTLQVSEDGTHFQDAAKRTEGFHVWTADLGGREARYVRVTKDQGYIALMEIEVYGRP